MSAPPRSRKRRAKTDRRRRFVGSAVATAALGLGCCCSLADGSSTSGASSTAGVFQTAAGDGGLHAKNVSYRVAPKNNNNGGKSEGRRRLEREYYRNLAKSSSSSALNIEEEQDRDAMRGEQSEVDGRQGEAVEVISESNNISDGDARRLASNAVQHKKGRGYDQAPLHQKGNMDEGSEGTTSQENVGGEPSVEYTLLGSNSAGGSSHGEKNDRPVAPRANGHNGGSSEGGSEDEGDPRRATNLRSFARIGGSGYTLPPSKRYPYMASLQMEGHEASTGNPFDVHTCGGVLVAPDVVLTSAHCGHYSPPDRPDEVYQAFNGIEVGKSDLSDEGAPFDPYSLETHRLYYENLIPETLVKHPDYDEVTYEHDLMLVKVFGKSRYPPAKLATEDDGGDDDDNAGVTALGWGAETATSAKKYSDKLRESDMDIVPIRDCRKISVQVTDPDTSRTSTLSLRKHVLDDMICATSEDRYMCYGDAGGPAITKGDNSDEDTVRGVLSWGYGCVDRSYPAVMTNVATKSNGNWIRDTICELSSDPPEWYGCFPNGVLGGMTQLSGNLLQTVTLKIKLDMMSVETGFVIQVRDTGEVVAQRQVGYYKSEQNEIILETMDLPRNVCYRLVLLDSYGDGFCCDMGGGSATLYWGTEVGYYDGQVLAQVHGNFESHGSDEFCLTSPADTIQVATPKPTPSRPHNNPPPPPTPRPPSPASASRPSGKVNLSSGWTGPEDDPSYQYCKNFCQSSSHGMVCGGYECVHVNEDIATDSDQEEPPPTPAEPTVQVMASGEFYDSAYEEYLTVQIKFDNNPEEVSWVLYDKSTNEVKVFVDFDAYSSDEYAGNILNIIVSIPGAEAGEKEYAFTAYDRSSDGLCCGHGQGYYKVFMGDVEDGTELLGDADYEFSSSYYFTLFEMEGNSSPSETPPPSRRPTNNPTPMPTKFPTRRPSPPSPQVITGKPTTERPTQIWERVRPENADEIGARWSTGSHTPPGVFNDVGGDVSRFAFEGRRVRNAAARHPSSLTSVIVGGSLLMLSFGITLFN